MTHLRPERVARDAAMALVTAARIRDELAVDVFLAAVTNEDQVWNVQQAAVTLAAADRAYLDAADAFDTASKEGGWGVLPLVDMVPGYAIVSA